MQTTTNITDPVSERAFREGDSAFKCSFCGAHFSHESIDLLSQYNDGKCVLCNTDRFSQVIIELEEEVIS